MYDSRKTIEQIIKKDKIKTFLYGEVGFFCITCLDIVKKLTNKNNSIKNVYVRTNIYNPLNREVLKDFDEIYFPNSIENTGKHIFLERDKCMVDRSDVYLFYFDKNYSDIDNKRIFHVYLYALSKNKKVINIYDEINKT